MKIYFVPGTAVRMGDIILKRAALKSFEFSWEKET